GILVMIILALIATYKVWFWDLLRHLAEHDIIVTNVEEGTGKLVMLNGRPIRFLTTDAAKDPDENWDLVRKGEKPVHPAESMRHKQVPLTGILAWIDRKILPGGMRYVGFGFMGYELYWYNFRWEVLRSSEPKLTEDGIVNKRQLSNGKWVASFAKRINYILL